MTHVRVWQTWRVVSPQPAAPAPAAAEPGHVQTHLSDGEALRRTLQQRRVQHMLPVAEVARRIETDVGRLSAFERGDDVLDWDTLTRLQRLLASLRR